jgi:hypothetical protein
LHRIPKVSVAVKEMYRLNGQWMAMYQSWNRPQAHWPRCAVSRHGL